MVLASFIAGVLVGAFATLMSTSLGARIRSAAPRRRSLLVGATLVLAVVAAAYIMYARLAPRSAAATPVSAAASIDRPNPAPAESMDAAVTRLESRLARGDGSEADWTLLAQAYEFLGRPEDAQRARGHIVSRNVPSLSAAELSAASATLDTQRDSTSTPGGTAPSVAPRAQSWLVVADTRRAQRDFAGARQAYEQAIAHQEMTAQSWADYADTVASLDKGSLSGAAAAAIDRALALDATNVKALWLKASQEHEQRRYAQALVWWGKLRAVLPRDSADVRIIDGNIAEDRALSDGATASSATGAVTGTVVVDGRYANRIGAKAILFIYAKSADSPGPPLAVLRTAAANWPVSFRLDDTLAMLPSRKLSQFDKVIIEARVSRSGEAMPASGDLYTTSAVVHPAEGKKLALVIDHEIG